LRGYSPVIPESIGKLTELETLVLWVASGGLFFLFNILEIPSSIGQLSKLKTLSFLWSCPGLKGSLPPSMGNLTSLEIFLAEGTRLTGEIPEEMGSLKNLRTFVLKPYRTYEKLISGNVPDSFSTMANLTRFYVSGNDISGKLPPLSLKLESCGIDLANITCHHKNNTACAGAGVQGMIFVNNSAKFATMMIIRNQIIHCQIARWLTR
jgi:hypothetical protein